MKKLKAFLITALSKTARAVAVGSSAVLGVAVIITALATCLLGLRLIAWMNESDYRMRKLEQQVAAMQDMRQSEPQSKQSPQTAK